MNQYIEDLFLYLDRFENQKDQFDSEAFLQTYNGVYTVFQALHEQRAKSVEVDNQLLERVKRVSPGQSDLRLLTTQLLVSFFEAEADIDGQSNKAYLYCRSLREIRQDIPYFESHLVPLLFKDGALNYNLQLNTFFLNEFARYINRHGQPFEADLKPEAFNRMPEPSQFLLLARRRQALGGDLQKDRASLEFQLQQVNALDKLAARSRTHREHLTEWGYLRQTSFWASVSAWFGELFGRLGGAFSSWRYFTLVIKQRNAAYVACTIAILLALFLSIYVPIKWNSVANDRLQDLTTHADDLQSRTRGK